MAAIAGPRGRPRRPAGEEGRPGERTRRESGIAEGARGEGMAGWRGGAVARCRVGHHLEPSLAGEGSREGSRSAAAGFGAQLGPWPRGLPPLHPYSLGACAWPWVPRKGLAFLSGDNSLRSFVHFMSMSEETRLPPSL